MCLGNAQTTFSSVHGWEYKNIMKSLRTGTKNPKETPSELCGMAVAFLLLGQVAFEGLIFHFFSVFPNAVRSVSPCGEEECHLLRALLLQHRIFYRLDFTGTASTLAFPKKTQNTLDLKPIPWSCVCAVFGCREAWPWGPCQQLECPTWDRPLSWECARPPRSTPPTCRNSLQRSSSK